MNANSSKKMRELVGNEVAAVNGGLIGTIPGYTPKVQLPDSLFGSGSVCRADYFNGQFVGGVCSITP